MGCGSSKDPVVDMRTELDRSDLGIREETGDSKAEGKELLK